MSEKKAGYIFVMVILAILVVFFVVTLNMQCAGKVMVPYQTIKHDTVYIEATVDHVVDQDIIGKIDTVVRVDTVIKPVRGKAVIVYSHDTVYIPKGIKSVHDTIVEYLSPKKSIIDWISWIIVVVGAIGFAFILIFGEIRIKK